MFAIGKRFFKNFLYVLDFVVIVTAIVLEVFLREELAGFLAIFRLWRLARIGMIKKFKVVKNSKKIPKKFSQQF